MDSSSGIGQSGRQNACEIPVNSGSEIRFDPANVDPRPGGCLDLLKALSDPSRSEYFFSDLKASQICWNSQIPGYGFRDPLAHLNSSLPSQQFMIPPPDLNRNFEPPGPRGDFGDINWNFGLPCSPEIRKDTTGNQNMIQFSPPTPDKNKTVVAGEHSDMASKDLGDAQQELPNPLVEESPGANQKSSSTPNQKPKRRKVRPKVVIEGKKQRQRKAATPKPVTTPEIPRVKRKYARKHKDVPGTSNGKQVEHATGNNNVQQASERVIYIDVEEAPVQQASKRKAATMLPVNTPEIPRVERKYKWKQKKDPPGISDGKEVVHDNARQSARRALNFHVEEATKEESSSKNADIVTNFEVDALHKLGGALKNAGGDVGSSPQVGFSIDLSVNRVEESKLQENDNHVCEKSQISSCNAQNASRDSLENAAGLVSSSWQVDVGVGSFVNLLQECKPRENVNLIDEVSQPRKNILSGTRNSCCNAQHVLESTGGVVGSSPQPDFGVGLSVNLLQENVNRVNEVSEPQKNVLSTTQTSRPHGLRENMKTLARKRNGLGRQIISGISEAQGTSTSTLETLRKKRSKREQNDTVCDNENRSFNLYDGSGQVMCNGSYNHPLPVIPEQWKRKRAEIKQSQYHLNVSSSLLPSSSNEVPSCENGQKTLSCMTAETVPRNDLLDINVNYVPSTQVSDLRLIAQANAMCYSQLPSSLSYHSDPPSDRTRAVTEATHSGVPRKGTATKKGKAPEVGASPSGYPLQKKRKAEISSSFSLYSTFSQYSILEHMDHLVQKLICLDINGIADVLTQSAQNENALIVYNGNGTIVPYDSLSNLPKRRKPRPRVNLDSETNRVWLLLMGTASADAPEGTDAQKEKWWEEERRVFQGRAESFIARMHLVQGDRRFSPWKGSVVDSVVGVFLTQNVSDHLSSSAFMNLAARFPIQRTMDCNEVEIPTENGDVCLAEFDSNMKEQERLTKESVDSEDSGCTKSLDNAAIDLNSVASSQNSSDSPAKEYSNTGACLQSQINPLHVPDGKMFPDFSSTSSFMELLEAASNMFYFLPGETAAGATHQQELFPCDQEKSTSDPIYKDKDATTSIGKCESHSPKECNDPNGVPFVSSAIPNIYQSNYLHVGLENTDVAKEKPPTSAANTVGAIDSCNISNPCNCYSTKDTAEATGLEASGLTSQCSPSSDPHAKINNRFDRSQGEVRSQQHARNHNSPPPETQISFLNNCTLPLDECGANVHQSSARKEFQGGILNSSTKASAQAQGNGACELQHAMFHPSIPLDGVEFSCTRKAEENIFIVTPEPRPKAEPINGAHEMPQAVFHHPNASDGMESSCTRKEEVKAFTTATGSDTKAGNIKKEAPVVEKRKRKRVEKNPIEPVDWDLLRKQGCNDVEKQRSRESMDSVDWEAIRRADVSELSDCIRERGMNNRLAERIKEFLDRLVKDHGSIDLEWLRSVPPDKVKDYLLSIKGLGLKSVECVRLLTLHNLAFPVDTNVGRICVRLGWVPLQPLPESLQLHLLELYPILETIQKYLWPRLCKLDQRTLYELHYQMITFGKVFCTKSRPNCNACPMRGECKHFASAFASARLALPGPEEKGVVASTVPAFSIPEHRTNVEPLLLPQLEKKQEPQQNIRLIAQSPSEDLKVMALPQQEITNNPEEHVQNNSQPIIEEPTTPEPECLEAPEPEIEDLFYEDSDEIPTIKLNIEKFTENLQNIMQASNVELQEADISKALVALTPDAASLPQPKLKNISRLRTEHRVYELPDSHPLVEGLEPREPDDPSPYLLAIWSPGETAESLDLPQPSCSSQATGVLCAEETCSVCSCIREERAQIVRGTLLIPCRTAMRGSFPLNGTYFQVNEVFADHSSSLNPIDIPRQWIWNLPRRTVYFGTSVTTIFKGMTTEAIQQCFWRGFVCVRGFERQTRAPRPLMARLHFPASKVQKNKRDNGKEKQGQ